jgi:hypothetical protein
MHRENLSAKEQNHFLVWMECLVEQQGSINVPVVAEILEMAKNVVSESDEYGELDHGGVIDFTCALGSLILMNSELPSDQELKLLGIFEWLALNVETVPPRLSQDDYSLLSVIGTDKKYPFEKLDPVLYKWIQTEDRYGEGLLGRLISRECIDGQPVATLTERGEAALRAYRNLNFSSE